MSGLNEQWTSEDHNGDVSLTSLKLTIALSFFGMVWSITSYILSTKWKCFDNQSLWETNVFPNVKTHWESHVFPTIKHHWPRSLPPKSMHYIDDGDSTSQYSVNTVRNYQTISGSDEENLLDDDNGQVELTITKRSDSETDDEQPAPLFGSCSVITIFSLAQILAKPLVIIVNIVYLVLNYNRDFDLFLSNPIGYQFRVFIDYTIIQETTSLIIGPAIAGLYWVSCWRQCRVKNSCRKYLEFLRFNDLQFALQLAPYANTHLYALGGWWYIVILVRLAFYAITFASSVIAGMRCVCACYCKICCSCGCDSEVLEIRNINHLLVEIGLKLIGIFLKLNTCSSAVATYFKLGTRGGPSFQHAYLAFCVIRGITSLWSLGFTGAMLRWSVLKREHKWDDRSWLTKVLKWLNKYEPHVHVSFFFDMLTYFGLLILNLVLIELLNERNYYCTANCQVTSMCPASE